MYHGQFQHFSTDSINHKSQDSNSPILTIKITITITTILININIILISIIISVIIVEEIY